MKRWSGSPMVRITPRFEVLDSADIVDDREIRDVVKERVDREVSTASIFRRRAENNILGRRLWAISGCIFLRLFGGRLFPVIWRFRRFRAGTKGGDFDDTGSEEHMRKSEPPPDDTGIAKQSSDLLRPRIGRYIKIFGSMAEQEITYATANQVGQHIRTGEADRGP